MKVEEVSVIPFSNEAAFARKVSAMESCRLSFLYRDKDDLKEYNSPTTCKDYMGDMLYYSKLNIPFTSVQNKGGEVKECIIKLRVPIELRGNIIRKLHILTNLEKRCNIPQSVIKKVKGNKDEVVLFGNDFWIQSPFTLSIYMQIFRSLAYYTNKRLRSVDSYFKYLSTSINNRDGRIASNIVKGKVSIPFVLNNIEYILGDNKITGLNDEAYKRRETEGVLLLSVGNDNRQINTACNHSNHSYSGIEFFAQRYVQCINCNNLQSYINISARSNGFLWAFNYWKLLKGYDKLDAR